MSRGGKRPGAGRPKAGFRGKGVKSSSEYIEHVAAYTGDALDIREREKRLENTKAGELYQAIKELEGYIDHVSSLVGAGRRMEKDSLAYCRMLILRSMSSKNAKLPVSLVEAKRVTLKIKRLVKEIKEYEIG
jgi:hypothetical protein